MPHFWDSANGQMFAYSNKYRGAPGYLDERSDDVDIISGVMNGLTGCTILSRHPRSGAELGHVHDLGAIYDIRVVLTRKTLENQPKP